MKREDEHCIEKVKFILNSGDEGIIHTMKITIDAYLDCIATNRKHEALIKKTAELEKVLKKEKKKLTTKKGKLEQVMGSNCPQGKEKGKEKGT